MGLHGFDKICYIIQHNGDGHNYLEDMLIFKKDFAGY